MKQTTLLVCFLMYTFFSYGQAEQIGSFTLVEAGSGTALMELAEGTELNTATTASGINVRANTVSATVGSVVFSLNGPLSKNMTENVAPYTLFGDFNGEYFGENLPEGAYTLTATAFTEERGEGIAGDAFTINFSVVAQPGAIPFITTWDTRNSGVSAINQIRIPTSPGETYNYNVDWGDGSSSTNVAGTITHEYEIPDVYRVSITGVFPRIFFNNGGDRQKLISIDQWGDIAWESMESAFRGCANMQVLASDIPNLLEVTSLEEMFADCSVLSGNEFFNNWNVTSILTMNSMFQFSNFNADLNNWDVQNVRDMSGMFSLANSFNGNIEDWNVSNVRNMSGMFFDADDFIGSLSNWNVERVTNMTGMFSQMDNFNGDVSNWNVSNVTNTVSMFDGASSFDQSLENWDISSMETMAFMFEEESLSRENYDATLLGWSTLTSNEVRIPENVAFGGGNSNFCLAESARQELTDNFGWAIRDGGLNCEGIVPEVINFTLVAAGAGAEISVLTEDTIIDETVTAEGVNIIANTNFENVGSVVFSLTGPENREMTENVAPYTLFGDFQGEFFGRNLPAGAYIITATAFTEERGGGQAGTPLSINFTIGESEPEMRPFITTWDLRNAINTVFPNSITIPTVAEESYNYSVDWGDGNMDTGVTGNITHRYETIREYVVTISGDFPRIQFAPSFEDENNQKIRFVNQWGDIEWSSMEFALANCENLDVLATDIPDLSRVTSMASMFANCFSMFGNPTFGDWDVSTIEDTNTLFSMTGFNHDLSNWDVSNVTNMGSMFGEMFFNQDISGWDVSNVTNMGGMFFANGAFDQDISSWNVSKVMNMNLMFADTRFNQDISGWDVSNVTNMGDMFFVSRFDQDLSDWDISSVTTMSTMFEGAGLSRENYDNTLIGWATLDTNEIRIPENINFDGGRSQFCLSEGARGNLIGDFGWVITDGGQNCPNMPFVTTWKTDNEGVSNDNQIIIPTFPGATYNYSVDWGDGNTDTNVTGSIQHTYEEVGTYTVSIEGDFPRIYFNETFPDVTGDAQKLVTIEQWGNIQWTSMDSAFEGCANMELMATDKPNLFNVRSLADMFNDCRSMVGNPSMNTWDVRLITDMQGMFNIALNFNQDLNEWNVAGVRDMQRTFANAQAFVGDISEWDVDNVRNMERMFFGGGFNGDISNWDVSQVRDMDGMFDRTRFNQNINNWDVSNVTSMQGMFFLNRVFNQDISGWDVSNVVNFISMFSVASEFNQDLGSWDISSAQDRVGISNMLLETSLSVENYDSLLIGWSTLDENETRIPTDLILNIVSAQYCIGGEARQRLIDTFGWSITDRGQNCAEIPVIGELTLVEIGSGNSIVELIDGTVLSQEDIGAGISVVVNTLPENIGSVRFSLSGVVERIATENVAPYTLFGDFNGEFFGRELTEGAYTLAVTPYSGPDRTGERGATRTINFTVEAAQRPFVTTWKTDNIGLGNDNQVVIGINDRDFNYDYTIDWGDGSSSSNTHVSGSITHTYANPGTYVVSISGIFPNAFFAFDDFNGKLLSVDQWGDIAWQSSGPGFADCGNMDVLAEDVPNLSNVTSLRSMFSQCTSLVGNSSFSSWNVQNINNMSLMFANTAFNQDIGGWNVGQVEEMFRMFIGTPFNQDIGNWNVDRVTTMERMFYSCSDFNQDIGDWDTASVQIMTEMFALTQSFDQDLGDWDISSIRNMQQMFEGSTLSSENYDLLLTGWSTLDSDEMAIPSNVSFSASPIQFCLGEDGRQLLIDDFEWDITDGGRNCDDAASITALTLLVLDIDDFPPFNEDLFRLEDGETYFINTLFNFQHTIRANTNPETIGSVVFSLSGAINQEFTDNTAPYILLEGSGLDFVEGTYNLSVTAYSGPNGEGTQGETRSLSFTLEGPSSNRLRTSELYGVSLYPNEATTTVNISVSDPDRTLRTIVVHDMLGRKVGEYAPAQIKNGNRYQLAVDQMQGGMYIVSTVDDQGGVHKMRLLVNH